MAERFDVVVVGAGISGIGAGYRLQTECPQKRFVILEGRADLGGTWDLFRYPGIRSDSDMFTLGFPWRPWKGSKAIADGPSILRYIRETATESGIDRHIRFDTRVVSASWSSERATWLVETVSARTGEATTYEASWLHVCSGYYRYDHGYEPEFPGRERFSGPVVHPQHWPEDLDYAGKRVVVIGSGATAVTLVPAMAETAASVTMLQRSPTYVVSAPASDAVADLLRSKLPEAAAHHVVRWKNVLMATAFFQFCQQFPKAARRLIEKGVEKGLPGYPIAPDFAPRYDPWDQRLCLVPDGDLFAAIREGRAAVVTDRIRTFTETGIELESGKVLEADVIVTATGLELLACGGISIEADGHAVSLPDAISYRGFMLSGVPNFSMAIGYTNASWTLRADLCSRAVCRLLNHLERTGYSTVVPTPPEISVSATPILDLSSGYVTRGRDVMPKQGSRQPWRVRHNYVLDLLDMRLGNPTTDLAFSGGHTGESRPRATSGAQYQP